MIGSDTEGPLDTLMVDPNTALIVVLEVETAAPEAIGAAMITTRPKPKKYFCFIFQSFLFLANAYAAD